MSYDDRLQEVLEKILVLEAQSYAAILENTPPEKLTAAMLTSARQFLADQGVSLESLQRMRPGNFSRNLVEKLAEIDAEDDEAVPPLPEAQWHSLGG